MSPCVPDGSRQPAALLHARPLTLARRSTSHRPRRRALARSGACQDGVMDFALSPELEALRDRARRYVVDELQPLEVAVRAAGGRLPRRSGRSSGARRSRPGSSAATCPRRSAASAGRTWSRSSSRSSSARSPAGSGRTCPARTTSWPCRRRPAQALPRAEPARRALGQLRDHRAERRLRPADPRVHRGPRRRHRGVGAQRREVVRHRARRHRLHDLPRRSSSTATRRLPTLFLVDYDTPGLRHEPRPRLHPHVRRPPPAVHPRGRARPGRGAPRRRSGRPTT